MKQEMSALMNHFQVKFPETLRRNDAMFLFVFVEK